MSVNNKSKKANPRIVIPDLYFIFDSVQKLLKNEKVVSNCCPRQYIGQRPSVSRYLEITTCYSSSFRLLPVLDSRFQFAKKVCQSLLAPIAHLRTLPLA